MNNMLIVELLNKLMIHFIHHAYIKLIIKFQVMQMVITQNDKTSVFHLILNNLTDIWNKLVVTGMHSLK